MLKNYFTIAYRTLVKNNIYSLINIFGLSFGMATTLLIILWVQDELEFDHFHKNLKSIHRIMENQRYTDGNIFTTSSNPAPLVPYLKETYPEVKYASRYTWPVENLLRADKDGNFESGRHVDKDFLKMYTFELVEGDLNTALDPVNAIVMTESLARKYFGDNSAVGKPITLNDTTELNVTAVIKDLPANSSLTFDYLLTFEKFWNENKSWLDEWGNNNVSGFVQLADNTSAKAFEDKIADDIKDKNEGSNVTLFLQPLSKYHLYSKFENGEQVGGRITNVKVFSIIAFVILLIACINFMNLSTAQATKRAKEVGLRKVVGAYDKQLIFQFLGESLLYSLIAAVLAGLIVYLLLPYFNDLTAKELTFNILNSELLLYMLLITVFTGLFAGSYPAVYLIRYQPARVLKGIIRSGKEAATFRKVLVVIQFTLAIVLIVSTIVVYQQLNYLQNQDIGFNRERLLYMEMHQGMGKNYETIRKELLNDPSVEHVTAMNMAPLNFGNSTYGLEWEGKDPDAMILFSNISADFDFTHTFEMELVEGRSFDRKYSTDTANFLINEEAARKMGFERNAAEQPLTLWGDRKGKIVGVIKDFNFSSSHQEIQPLLIALEPDWFNYIVVRAKGGNMDGAISAMEKYHKMYAPAYPFEYKFVDDQWSEKYEAEERVGVIFNYFAVLSIIISCLGLFALAAYAAERRVKEIGVRKALGASILNITGLMTREFTWLVIISAALACPIAWYLMDAWLDDFAYKINIGFFTFVIATLLSLFIALGTVGFHAVKAALSNPVKALRYE